MKKIFRGPVLTKNIPHPNDYKPMTWERFIKLRKWAQSIANELQAPVYLVGSSLEKEVPRDIDVSVVFPLAVYEERFGKIPDDSKELGKLMDKVHLSKPRVKAYFDAMSALDRETNIDLKFCPDTWWPDKDKLLLAVPKAIGTTEYARAVKGFESNHHPL